MRARAVPLAALVTATAVLFVWRMTRTPTGGPAGVSAIASSARVDGGPPPLTASAPPSASVATPLPSMIHEDARHTHRARGRGPRDAHVQWRTAVDGPIAAQVTSSPDGHTLYVGTLGGSLVALDRADGGARWRLSLGDRVYSTPTVAPDGTIYVGSDAKKMFAVSPHGEIQWQLEADGDCDTGAAILANGDVVFACGNGVYAAHRGGDLAWRFRARGKVFTAPAITDAGQIIFGAQDDHAYALDRSGALAWSSDLGADVDGAPSISDDGAIYVGDDAGEIVRLGDGGKITWRTKVGGYVRGVLSVARNGDVLAGTYGPLPRVVRVSKDGVILGSFAIHGPGSLDFGVHGAPLEDDLGTLFFGTQDDAAYAIDLRGAVLFRYVTEGDVDAPLTLLPDGALVVPSEDGSIAVLGP